MKHLRIYSTYICLNRAALTHSFQLGSSHRWNRQGIAQANWNLCYLVGAVLFSLFTGVSATVFLLRDSYSGWVGVSWSLQGGWPFSGVHRRGDTKLVVFGNQMHWHLPPAAHNRVVLLQLFFMSWQEQHVPRAGPVPVSIYQAYQTLEALTQNSSVVVAFIDKASSPYYEQNVLWRYGVRRFRPVPALLLPACGHGRALSGGLRDPSLRGGAGAVSRGRPRSASARPDAPLVPPRPWHALVPAGRGAGRSSVRSGPAVPVLVPPQPPGVRGWKVLSAVWALLGSHWSTDVLPTLFAPWVPNESLWELYEGRFSCIAWLVSALQRMMILPIKLHCFY